MSNELTQSKMMQLLDWSYDKAVNGVIGLDSATKLAESYIKSDAHPYDQANSLIRWQNTTSATSGFLSGLGGIITLPIAIPANIASVLFVQIRMIAALAHMGGYDIRDNKVKVMIYTCLAGNAAKEIVKDVGIKVGEKIAVNTIKSISGKTISEINKQVGFRLLTKFGEKGMINLGKTVPLIGGIIGATFDSVSTNQIGNVARNTFIQHKK